jgi:FMN reductase
MTSSNRVGVIVGNPKPRSRTYEAALLVAEQVTGEAPGLVIDLADLGPALLDWKDEHVADLVKQAGEVDVLVVASPTYKATYTGLLKLFLDRFSTESLAGVVAIPLMLGGSPAHTLAPEVSLKPLLFEIGATVPTRAVYLLDSTFSDPASLAGWLDKARGQVASARRSAAV